MTQSVSEMLVKDTRMCAKSACISLETGIATLDRDGSPARSLSQGYMGQKALGELRVALTHARKAEELLKAIEEGGPKPDGTT